MALSTLNVENRSDLELARQTIAEEMGVVYVEPSIVRSAVPLAQYVEETAEKDPAQEGGGLVRRLKMARQWFSEVWAFMTEPETVKMMRHIRDVVLAAMALLKARDKL